MSLKDSRTCANRKGKCATKEDQSHLRKDFLNDENRLTISKIRSQLQQNKDHSQFKMLHKMQQAKSLTYQIRHSFCGLSACSHQSAPQYDCGEAIQLFLKC